MVTSQDSPVNIPPQGGACNQDTFYREKNVLTSSAACRDSAAILLHEVKYRGGGGSWRGVSISSLSCERYRENPCDVNETSDITEQCIQGSPFPDIVQYSPQAGLTSMFLAGAFFVPLTMCTLT